MRENKQRWVLSPPSFPGERGTAAGSDERTREERHTQQREFREGKRNIEDGRGVGEWGVGVLSCPMEKGNDVTLNQELAPQGPGYLLLLMG